MPVIWIERRKRGQSIWARPPKPPKKPNGHPLAEIDIEVVRRAAALQCTNAEIAALAKVGVTTLRDRLKSDPELARVVEEERENGKASLRRLQWKSAQDGNVTAQIWLGKQYLDQTDRRELSTPPDRPLEVRDVTPIEAARRIAFVLTQADALTIDAETDEPG